MPTPEDLAENIKPTANEQETNPVAETAHKMLLISIGAAATVIEESYALTHKLLEKGVAVEKEGRKRMQAMNEKRKARSQESAGNGIHQRIGSAANRITPFSKNDIASLNEQLDELSNQIDAIATK